MEYTFCGHTIVLLIHSRNGLFELCLSLSLFDNIAFTVLVHHQICYAFYTILVNSKIGAQILTFAQLLVKNARKSSEKLIPNSAASLGEFAT